MRSLALRFRLTGGEEWRTGMNSIPVFLVRTPEAFYEQILAGKLDLATGKPNATAVTALSGEADHQAAAESAARPPARATGGEALSPQMDAT